MELGKSCCLLPAPSSAPALAARCRVPPAPPTPTWRCHKLSHRTLRCHLADTLEEELGGPSSCPLSTWPSPLNPQPLDNLDGFVQSRDGWCRVLSPQLSRAGQMHQHFPAPGTARGRCPCGHRETFTHRHSVGAEGFGLETQLWVRLSTAAHAGEARRGSR